MINKIFVIFIMFISISCSTSNLFNLATYVSPKYKMTKIRVNESNGKQADFRFKLLSDSSLYTINDYKGKLVLLNFWATWCAPCIEEIPELNKIMHHYEAQIVVISVSDENPEKINKFLSNNKLECIKGFIGKEENLNEPFRQLRRGRPLSFLIDSSGIIQKAYPFPITLDEVKDDIEEHL